VLENGLSFMKSNLVLLCLSLVKMTAIEYEDNESKFIRKAKENPFVPAGEFS